MLSPQRKMKSSRHSHRSNRRSIFAEKKILKQRNKLSEMEQVKGMSLERGEKRNLVFGREDGGSSGAVKAVKQLIHSPSHVINLFRA